MQSQDTVLFLDARHIYTQIDRAHREFTVGQIGFLASIVRLYRGESLNGYGFDPAGLDLSGPQLEACQAMFAEEKYADVAGLCKVARRAEIEAQGWSLNPGRYVGVTEQDQVDYDFTDYIQGLNEELEILNLESHELEDKIAENMTSLLGS